jgi:RND superfamily putative drug exporter
LERLTRFSRRHRRLVTVVWLALAVAGGWAASSISDALSRAFDAPGRAAFQANAEIVRAYGSGGPISPYVAVIALDGERRITDARAELEQAERRLADAVPGSRTASWASTGERAFVSRDGRTSYVLVFPPVGVPDPDENPRALAATRAAARELEVAGAPVRITGIEALADDSGTGGGIGLLVEVLLGGVGALIVLALVFASPLAVVPIVIATVSILTSFLALRALTEITDISFVVQFLVGLIGLGVAIDYALLIVVRWREERARGLDNDDAVDVAMRTAGHSVAVSGVTVAIGLLALVVVPVPFIRSIGIGGLLIPLISVIAALTLLPAILAGIGPRLDRRHDPQRDRDPGRRWSAWARLVVRRRWPAAVVGLLVLVVLAAFATQMRPGRPSVDALSAGGTARQALQALERSGIGSGALTPVEVLSDGKPDRRVAEVEGVRGVATPAGEGWERGDSRLSAVLLADDASSDAGQRTLDTLRDLEGVRVGGPDAQDRDLTEAIYASFPLMLALIALITFVLLAWALRSVLLPLKAIALNVLSVGAAFGIVVLIWQEGLGSQLIGGVPATGSITNWVPLAIFAFLYGLSMDYEVFILARMREEYERTGSTDEAVIGGLGRTGRLVTSAALILFLAFVALAASPGTEIRILATGLAAGILLDATVVRALVVPALVTLFGEANWWLPPWAAARGAADRVGRERRGDQHEEDHQHRAGDDLRAPGGHARRQHEDDRRSRDHPGRVCLVEDVGHPQQAVEADRRKQQAEREQDDADGVEDHQKGPPRVT